MSTTLEEFQTKFQVRELTVLRTPHWTWSVRPGQATIGAGVLSLNRFATSFGDLTAEEGADLAAVVGTLERTLRAVSQPDKFNYLMLMMIDVHVHFHVLPRYAAPRTLLGQEWVDTGWPALPDLGANANRVAPEGLVALRDQLVAALI